MADGCSKIHDHGIVTFFYFWRYEDPVGYSFCYYGINYNPFCRSLSY